MIDMCMAAMFVVMNSTTAQATGHEVFVDPSFERGFLVTAASHPAPKVDLGVLQTTTLAPAQPPAWRMAQWASRFLLEPGVCKREREGLWLAETPGKRVAIDRSRPGLVSVRLEALGIAEYAGHLRAYGEAWPHLLIEQRFDNPIRLATLKRLGFAIEMGVPYCKAAPSVRMDPGLHAAHVSAFWTVHNLTPGNADYQDMIWFGIPFFDVRREIPGPHYALDSGKADASHKFICTLDGNRFWKGPTGDGQWRAIEVNLCELMREGLAISQKHGHLTNTRFEDLAVTTFNLGWEMPGPYDAAFEFRGLSMTAFE